MKAIITVGLGFGDEGKGATVDFLTRELGADLVVRYSGGAQAGHNVQLPDGRRHTFSQFGAGTLAGARTYLGPRMIISPSNLPPEAQHLRSLGVNDPWDRIAAHPDCLVATGYHVLMNRLRETSRGDAKHGSCGLGVGEARHYWLRYGLDAVFAGDLMDRHALLPKLALLRDRFLLEMQELPSMANGLGEALHSLLPFQEADLLQRAAENLAISRRLPTSAAVIFEGAQGVLLDEWKGFHPHTTWSTVTPLHAWEMLAEHPQMLAEHPQVETTVLGVTRGYTTRHGAGPFPTYSRDMTAKMSDPGNPRNAWQDSIRFGALDLTLLAYAARASQIDGVFVNCLDELPKRPRVATAYEGLTSLPAPRSLKEQEQLTRLLNEAVPVERATTPDDLLQRINSIAPVVGWGRGPTCDHREFASGSASLAFRPRLSAPPDSAIAAALL